MEVNDPIQNLINFLVIMSFALLLMGLGEFLHWLFWDRKRRKNERRGN